MQPSIKTLIANHRTGGGNLAQNRFIIWLKWFSYVSRKYQTTPRIREIEMTNETRIENPNHILTHKELLSLLKEVITKKDIPTMHDTLLYIYKMERSDFLKLWNRRNMKEDVFHAFVNYAVEKGMIVWDYMDSICFLPTNYFQIALKITKTDIGKVAPWVLPKESCNRCGAGQEVEGNFQENKKK